MNCSVNVILFPLISFLLAGCASFSSLSDPPPLPRSNPSDFHLEEMGFTIQVGAFASISNAGTLEQRLRERGVDVYLFKQSDGLYKVRFGDYPTRSEAENEAKSYFSQGLIGNYYIVAPRGANRRIRPADELRQELIETARQFLGIPYCWGGESAEQGFDCSGLTMAVYRLNGLRLPRRSASQYLRGSPVEKEQLQPGDLVFFATSGGDRVSHVGIYVGNGRFIHAPRPGRKVQVANLTSEYFAKLFLGGRRYLGPEGAGSGKKSREENR